MVSSAANMPAIIPTEVKAVITLGSPLSGDPKQNNVWQLYERVAKHPVDDPPLPADHGQATGTAPRHLVAPRRSDCAAFRLVDLSMNATRRPSLAVITWRSAFLPAR